MDKKPFNQTKVGQLLSKVLPDNGIVGVLKNLVELDESLTPEDKEKAAETLLKAYEAEVNDRDSARKREIEIAKTGREDWLFNLAGIVGLGAFAFIIYAIIEIEVPEANKEIFIHGIGIVEGVALSIFGYYFGTSMKDNKK
jgi:hypothetical protein